MFLLLLLDALLSTETLLDISQFYTLHIYFKTGFYLLFVFQILSRMLVFHVSHLIIHLNPMTLVSQVYQFSLDDQLHFCFSFFKFVLGTS